MDTLVDYCGRLPLALAHAGVRAAAYTGVPLRDTVEALQQAGVGVDQAFACSYRELSASAARLFRSLATTLDPGSTITAEEAAALMTTSLPAGRWTSYTKSACSRRSVQVVTTGTSWSAPTPPGYRRRIDVDRTPTCAGPAPRRP